MGGKPKQRLMKDGLDEAAVNRLADNIKRAHSRFGQRAFVRQAMTGLDDLELKARVAHVAHALADHLPEHYPDALTVILAASSEWDRGPDTDPLRGFAAWPMFHFIEHHGAGFFDESMAAFPRLTELFTAEFAVRPFIKAQPTKAFAILKRWTASPSEHVRRLASEGCRPLLPWAQRLPELQRDPRPVLEILDQLKDDPSAFVRRSVANNLADIAKAHPERVISVCTEWKRSGSEERQWIIRRATRNLVKDGHPAVWSLLGFTEDPRVAVEELKVGPRLLRLGGTLRLEFQLRSTGKEEQTLVVDYVIHHQKANGTTSPKTFKLKNVHLPAKGKLRVSKGHPIRAISTRVYYPGTHRVEVTINGIPRANGTFELKL
jgi:3-methyladenine DNA glycosylase AlkC